MASCTEITHYGGRFVGDPLDVQMFQETGWTLDEDDPQVKAKVYPPAQDGIGYYLADETFKSTTNSDFINCIVRRFEFSSKLQRMSVICRNSFDQMHGTAMYKAFVKGSPELIRSLCRRDTIPNDFDQILSEYTREGYRVIALSVKILPQLKSDSDVKELAREEVEKDLTFLGLLVMENKMKAETLGVIETLRQCEVKTIMATGDNVKTAISVASQCGIIEDKSIVWLGDLKFNDQTE